MVITSTCLCLIHVFYLFVPHQSFGQETESIITLNLPGGAFPFIVKGCLCFSLFFTYPSECGLYVIMRNVGQLECLYSALLFEWMFFWPPPPSSVMMYPVALILERMFCINKGAVDSNSAYWKGVSNYIKINVCSQYLSQPLLS